MSGPATSGQPQPDSQWPVTGTPHTEQGTSQAIPAAPRRAIKTLRALDQPLNRKEGDLILGTGRSAIGTLIKAAAGHNPGPALPPDRGLRARTRR